MDARTDERLERWQVAGLLDAAAVNRIRQFELSQKKPSGVRWQVALALAFGAILLGAGVALFVAAHWDALSPMWRLTVALALVVVFHGVGLAVRPNFERLAIALHGVGTVAAGASVFLIGQIFNIQEDWPGGILLWCLCALAGWRLLRDQVQQTISLLLLPAWILCEWSFRTGSFRGSDAYGARMLAVFAALYLTAFHGSKRKFVAIVCGVVGAIALLIAIPELADTWSSWGHTIALPLHLRVVGWMLIAVAPLLAVAILHRASFVPVAVVLLVAVVLPHTHRTVQDGRWSHLEPNLLAYALAAALVVFLAWWGVRQGSRLLINVGILGFALVVLWFYFSDVMGKLDRSLSLMLLGVLFLGGGWLLERTRRRLVAGIAVASAEVV
jgi:uncharacterized membrane protein